MGSTVSEVIKQEHFDMAVKKVSIGNCIGSIKNILRIDIGSIFEELGGIEDILKSDPSGVFEKMDFKTKNYYRNIIKDISDKTKISENYIAETLLKLSAMGANDPVYPKKSHIGYYLLKDRNTLYKTLGVKYKEQSDEEKAQVYICANSLIPAMLSCILGITCYWLEMSTLISCLIAILSYIPFTEICIKTINFILNKKVKPTLIPKLDMSKGIPEDAKTFVVIPTLISNTDKISELIKKLEVYYLANKSENIYFALLGDCTSYKKKENEIDNSLAQKGLEEIAKLNEKYKETDFPKFHFLYRNRKWNSHEETYLGWERKRGLLNQFNRFLLKKDNSDFKVNSLIGDIEVPEIKYVITLDSDTNLTLNSGLELIGASEHILNTPILSEYGKIVKDGYGIIQPHVGVNLEDSYKSIFSKIYSLSIGTDNYTNAISDVYQDNFGEGIFTGKGIYNLKIFEEVLGNEIPENIVLSHDLLEGSYLRCALASDILLLDGYPAKYNSSVQRQHRWIRGDWQIIRWMRKRSCRQIWSYKRKPIK